MNKKTELNKKFYKNVLKVYEVEVKVGEKMITKRFEGCIVWDCYHNYNQNYSAAPNVSLMGVDFALKRVLKAHMGEKSRRCTPKHLTGFYLPADSDVTHQRFFDYRNTRLIRDQSSISWSRLDLGHKIVSYASEGASVTIASVYYFIVTEFGPAIIFIWCEMRRSVALLLVRNLFRSILFII